MEKIATDKINERVEKVRNLVKETYGEDICLDTIRLALLLGFYVDEVDTLPEQVEAQLYVSADGTQKRLTVNAAYSRAQKRFAIAHELSYYLLHYQPASGVEFQHEKTTVGRHTASAQMAEKLLVSEQHLGEAIKCCPGFHLAEMCKVFEVPEEVMVHQMRAYFTRL